MAIKKSGKNRYNFLIDSDVYNDFSRICDELGLVRSKKLEIYMRDFIAQNTRLIQRAKR